MRKLMIFCFTILFAVLSALSCLNFAFSALDQVEEDKLMLTIEKPAEQSNSDFLAAIDHALAGVHADLMFRHVDNSGEKSFDVPPCGQFRREIPLSILQNKPYSRFSRPARPHCFRERGVFVHNGTSRIHRPSPSCGFPHAGHLLFPVGRRRAI